MPASMLHMEGRKGRSSQGSPAVFSPPLSWLDAAWERLQSLSLTSLSPEHAQVLEAAVAALALAKRLTTLRIANRDALDPLMLSELLTLAQARMPCLRQLFLAVTVAQVMPAFGRLQHLHMQAAVYDDVVMASLLHLPELRTLCLEAPRPEDPHSVSAQMGMLNLTAMQQLEQLSLLRVEASRVLVTGSCRIHIGFRLAAVSIDSWARNGAHHVTLNCMSATSDELTSFAERAVFADSLQALSIKAERLGSPSMPFLLKDLLFSHQITSLSLLVQCCLVVSIPCCMPLERLLVTAQNLSLTFEDLGRFAGKIDHLGVWMHDMECPPIFQVLHGLLLARGLRLLHGENMRWSSHAFIQGCDYDFDIMGLWPTDHTMCECRACWSCLKRRGVVEVNKYGVG